MRGGRAAAYAIWWQWRKKNDKNERKENKTGWYTLVTRIDWEKLHFGALGCQFIAYTIGVTGELDIRVDCFGLSFLSNWLTRFRSRNNFVSPKSSLESNTGARGIRSVAHTTQANELATIYFPSWSSVWTGGFWTSSRHVRVAWVSHDGSPRGKMWIHFMQHKKIIFPGECEGLALTFVKIFILYVPSLRGETITRDLTRW